MRRLIRVPVLFALLALVGQARADSFGLSFSYGHKAPAPVVVAPAPVYIEPPVVVEPAPPVVVEPAPVYVAPPPVVVAPAPVFVPRYRYWAPHYRVYGYRCRPAYRFGFHYGHGGRGR